MHILQNLVDSMPFLKYDHSKIVKLCLHILLFLQCKIKQAYFVWGLFMSQINPGENSFTVLVRGILF